MKKFKIIVGNESAEIEPDEIPEALKAISRGGVVMLKHIIFNSSYFQAIVRDPKAEEMAAENQRYGIKDERASDFAGILAPKMKMLSPEQRDDALVEASTKERKTKK